jgi:hypothetical protein
MWVKEETKKCKKSTGTRLKNCKEPWNRKPADEVEKVYTVYSVRISHENNGTVSYFKYSPNTAYGSDKPLVQIPNPQRSALCTMSIAPHQEQPAMHNTLRGRLTFWSVCGGYQHLPRSRDPRLALTNQLHPPFRSFPPVSSGTKKVPKTGHLCFVYDSQLDTNHPSIIRNDCAALPRFDSRHGQAIFVPKSSYWGANSVSYSMNSEGSFREGKAVNSSHPVQRFVVTPSVHRQTSVYKAQHNDEKRTHAHVRRHAHTVVTRLKTRGHSTGGTFVKTIFVHGYVNW